MPLSLTVGSIIEKNKIASDVCFVPLLEIEVINPDTGAYVETVYLCNNEEDITYNSHSYLATSFDVGFPQEAGGISEISLNIKDYTRGIISLMEEYKGGIGFNVKFIMIRSDALDSDPEFEENFKVTGSNSNNFIVTFNLGAENPLTKRCPKRLQYREICSFGYKSTECGYAGALPYCDFTLTGDNGCIAHDNATNYGGFPGITR